ncbi:transposase [Streptococcus suis]|nr:transposase [Streptococcus suis]
MLFHFQEEQTSHFFDLIEEHLEIVNKEFKIVFKTILRYNDYIINALELPYSNAKLEATSKLIKDIKNAKLLVS